MTNTILYANGCFDASKLFRVHQWKTWLDWNEARWTEDMSQSCILPYNCTWYEYQVDGCEQIWK